MKVNDLFENIGIKLICLLIAVVVWLYANKGIKIGQDGENTRITFREVPVLLSGLPEEQWKPNPDKISLEVEFPTSEIASGAFQAVVNLTQADAAKKSVTLEAGNVSLPEGMNFIGAEPEEIELLQ